MVSSRIAAIFVALAFVSGAFIASPELRAYAAATITSADIVDGTIRSVDIGSAEVKASDIGNGQVTSAKIKDGNVMTSDLANDAVTSDKLADNVFDDLQAQIDALTAENAAQQAEIDDLEARVVELEGPEVVVESILITAVDNEGTPSDPFLVYAATASYSDGSSADVTNLAGWEELSNDLIDDDTGPIGGFLCIANTSGGSGIVRATYEGQTDTDDSAVCTGF